VTAPSEVSTAARWAVAFDVDAIQDYVFASQRPLDIMGASRIVEEFTEWAGTVALGAGARLVFAGGGNGLVLVDGEDAARRLAGEIEARFSKATAGGGHCSTAAVPCAADDATTWRRAQTALRMAKATHALDAAAVLVPAGTDPSEVCAACARELATTTDRVGDTDERIGDQCRRRRERGRAGEFPPDLEKLFDDERGLLAAVYLDGDGVGRMLTEAGSFDELKALAERIRSATRDALEWAVAELGLGQGRHRRYLAPVVGGDDILVFVDGRHSGRLLQRIWEHLRSGVPEIRFSAAVVHGLRRSPLRVLLDEAHWALDEAKEAAAKSEHPAVAVALLAGRRFAAGRSLLFGAPLDPARFDDLIGLTAAFARVEPSQRAGMAADIADASAKRAVLNLDYRAARSHEAAAALADARRFAHSDSDKEGSEKKLVATVAGALALAEEWGGDHR
jgi:hypothetical protein